MMMMMRRFSVLSFFTLLLVGGVARGATLEGVVLADTLEVGGKTLQLNGLGMREATILNVKVYVGGLYLEQRSSDAEAILASDQYKLLTLRFVRDVGVDDVRNGWSEGFEHNAVNLDAIADRVQTFNGFMADMKKGGDLTLTFLGDRVEVSVDGTQRGVIEGADFARDLLAIWLGPKPPNEGLKKGLLGG